VSYDDYWWDQRVADAEFAATEGMFQPVRCTHCRGIYDLGKVEVTARYTDCSMWKAPCCGRTVDDRGETGWKSRSDYTRLDRSGGTS
jgi:hypothetical protein